MHQHHGNPTPVIPTGYHARRESNWYAVHTMARHEKRVAAQFEEKRVCSFLPLLHQTHRWSDRRSVVEVPMFSCYAFVRMVQSVDDRLKVLRTPGVLGFVGSERRGTPIPNEQIESLRIAISEKRFTCSMLPIFIGAQCRKALGASEGDRLTASKESSFVKVELKA